VWCEVLSASRGAARRPALFLDRDGVIVEEVDYLHRVEDLRLVPGAAETIAATNACGIPVVIVSNQGGIGQGFYEWRAFQEVQKALLAELGRLGAVIDAVYACPYHPRGITRYAHADHPARKPRPGMILRASRALALDLDRSWIVGDKVTDLQAGQAAGMVGGLLVLTGYGPREREGALGMRTNRFDVRVVPSITHAVELLRVLAPGAAGSRE
jgi:D-glycero-D-manno-heptose 1,7-bisphosphate phosphatase